MARFIIFIFTLQTVFVSFSQAFTPEDNTLGTGDPPETTTTGPDQVPTLPTVFCAYAGAQYNVSYTFSGTELPPCCEAVVYGYYYVDMDFDPSDLDAITCLVQQGTTVFMFVTFGEMAHWDQFLDPADTTSFGQYIEPLEQFITENAINGIILDALGLFNNETQQYGQKLSTFICKIKEDVPGLLVGIMVPGDRFQDFGNVELFDFAETNEAVDMYVVDTTLAQNGCYENTTETGGRLPVTSTDPNSGNLEAITNAIIDVSGMDLTKVVVNFFIQATQFDTVSQVPTGMSYTDYCNAKSGDDVETIVWCVDSSQMFFDQAQFLKNSTAAVGMMLSYLDYDDYAGVCGCEETPFPVTNTYIDGWSGLELHSCDNLA